MSQVLVVDDDRTVLMLVEKALADDSVTIRKAGDAAAGFAALQDGHPDVVLLDIMLPDSTGLELARRVREFDAKLPIIFITAKDDSDTAIEAMQLGAYDYLLKPLDVEKVQDLVERALETRRLMQAPVHLHETAATAAGELSKGLASTDGDALVGRSPQMLEVYKEIGRVAAQDVTVLIRGESGTGKELVARAIYQHSKRKDAPFLAVNCAALTETLLESELFGHEKGAFTGADRRHIGKFEQCNGGTIFLDEIGDMSPLVQSKVLRMLQEQKFERVGGRETIETDVRIISATNRDLEQMIEDGEFRLDLFHRLNSFDIQLPPLRDRGDDVQLLLEHFLAVLGEQLDKRVTGISPDAIRQLTEYSWPGNVRELQSVLRKAILMATGPVLVPQFLPDEIVAAPEASEESSQPADDNRRATDLTQFVAARMSAGSNELYAESLEMMERYLLTRVLTETKGNQSKAAERLGITRGSLRHKLGYLNISIDQVVSSD